MSKNESSKKTTWEKLNTEAAQETTEQESATKEENNTQKADASTQKLTHPAYEALEEQLAKTEAQLEQHKSTLIYQRAEMENIKRRSQQDIEKAHKFSLEKFIRDLLPVKDNLERALELTQGTNNDTLKGIELTLQAFQKVLESNGVKTIAPAAGDAFDPDYHQAMSIQETSEQKPDTILLNLQKGYLLQERLIRPAAVIVAKAPTEKNS
ncbi:heat shock protein GrpE [Candidatus Rickettsiella viridis]|uniref:Protein GrpE n=1 Tax=Candidatus Rickettsiella viridis TaxID=676208 RepID=A0A2Z5V5C9_9COXI|nr:nucleotide exchange factor GrpE [Candidatus Rickettsiella viridis]BBB15622.1 heat shock protein GrpE [Candidatus Rickettsiella viridis]